MNETLTFFVRGRNRYACRIDDHYGSRIWLIDINKGYEDE